VGTSGSVFLRTPVFSELHAGLRASEAYAPDWRPRFAEAYRQQNLAWLRGIASGRPSPVASSAWDAYCATRVAETGVQALASGARQAIALIDKPAFYR
jgi:myo-inositol 2-dehydrogenase / D-chiro-inositol 1-dehydrogenase